MDPALSPNLVLRVMVSRVRMDNVWTEDPEDRLD